MQYPDYIILTVSFKTMQQVERSPAFTKVAQQLDQEALDTQAAMAAVEDWLAGAQLELPPNQVSRLDNALLNVAVNRILALEGSVCTATLLVRLADAISAEPRPVIDRPIDLSRMDG
ncbi:MAG: hypothetical protein AAF513_02130 [Pseudomonadota bacterium]